MLLNDISLESVFSGFKKCCMSNMCVEQTADDVIWEEDNEKNSSSSDENVGSNWFVQ
jgi:hypothetical protein